MICKKMCNFNMFVFFVISFLDYDIDNDSTAPNHTGSLPRGPPIPTIISFQSRPDREHWKAELKRSSSHARRHSKRELYAAIAVEKVSNYFVSQLQLKLVELNEKLSDLGRDINNLQRRLNFNTLPPSSAINDRSDEVPPSTNFITPLPPSYHTSPPQHKLTISPPTTSRPTHAIHVTLSLLHLIDWTILRTKRTLNNFPQCNQLLKWFWLKSARMRTIISGMARCNKLSKWFWFKASLTKLFF